MYIIHWSVSVRYCADVFLWKIFCWNYSSNIAQTFHVNINIFTIFSWGKDCWIELLVKEEAMHPVPLRVLACMHKYIYKVTCISLLYKCHLLAMAIIFSYTQWFNAQIHSPVLHILHEYSELSHFSQPFLLFPPFIVLPLLYLHCHKNLTLRNKFPWRIALKNVLCLDVLLGNSLEFSLLLKNK